MKDNNKFADALIAFFLIVLSIFLFITADKMPNSAKGIGPGDYPKFICVVILVLALIQVVTTLISSKGFPSLDLKSINVKFLLRALLMVVMTYIYYKLMKPVGFLLTTVVYLFTSFILFGYKKKFKAVVIAIVFTVIVYFLFTKVFMVFLPKGILG